MNLKAFFDRDQSGKQSRAALGFRRLVIAALVIATCYAAYGFGKLATSWRASAVPRSAVQQAVSEAAVMPPPLPVAGHWSFDDIEFEISPTSMQASDIAGRFEKLSTAAPLETDTDLAETGARLVELAKDLKVPAITQGQNEIYRIKRDNLNAQLVVCRDGAKGLQIVSIAVAYPVANGGWQLTELSPKRLTSGTIAATHLLPLPDGTVREGGRYADDSTLLLEFVALSATGSELVARWTAAGYEVRRSESSDDSTFSYLCRQGNQVVYAWSGDQPDGIKHLMLVRSPSAEDTGT